MMSLCRVLHIAVQLEMFSEVHRHSRVLHHEQLTRCRWYSVQSLRNTIVHKHYYHHPGGQQQQLYLISKSETTDKLLEDIQRVPTKHEENNCEKSDRNHA